MPTKKEDEVEKRKKQLEDEQKKLDEEQAAKEPPKASGMVDNAHKAAERLEAANKVTEELVERQEELAASAALGGESDAGQAPDPPKEETPLEYKDRVMAGDLDDKKE